LISFKGLFFQVIPACIGNLYKSKKNLIVKLTLRAFASIKKPGQMPGLNVSGGEEGLLELFGG
tara:strand:+ start:387 stop:575 length:189 start_codon:yes stop_codon:yes gene_type:complete